MKTRRCNRMSARCRRPAKLWHRAWAGASAAMLAASPAVAQTPNPYPDKKVEGWEISSSYPSGHSCFAKTVFSDGLTMTTSFDPDGDFFIRLAKESWVSLNNREGSIPITFEFDSGTVSTQGYSSAGTPPGFGTFFRAEEGKPAFAAWAASSRVHFVADGRSLGVYEIVGTRAAARELLRCMAALQDADPFAH